MAAGGRCRSINRVTTYRIVVEGELSDRFSATFDQMHLERMAGDTWITGEIVDQAQLQGLIARIADLGLALRSVGPVAEDSAAAPGALAPDRVESEVAAGGSDDTHIKR
jgi:hypothetical protein